MKTVISFDFDVMLICIFCFVRRVCLKFGREGSRNLHPFVLAVPGCDRFIRGWAGGRVEQSKGEAHAPIGAVARSIGIIFCADLKTDRLFAKLAALLASLVPFALSFFALHRARQHARRLSLT